MAKRYEKINKVSTQISKKLYDEIVYAKDNLNEIEKNKTQGNKKDICTMIEASHNLGKHLNSLRAKK